MFYSEIASLLPSPEKKKKKKEKKTDDRNSCRERRSHVQLPAQPGEKELETRFACLLLFFTSVFIFMQLPRLPSVATSFIWVQIRGKAL